MADNISLVQWTPNFQSLINGLNNNPNRHNLTRRGVNVQLPGNALSLPTESSAVVIGLITSGNATDGFNVTLYGNGVDNAPTGTAVNVPAVDMAMADSSCIGEYVPLFESTITVTAWGEVS